MVTPNPALEFPSGEGTRNVPMSDGSLVGDSNFSSLTSADFAVLDLISNL
ncbi:hypothetical protein E2C01_056026 [Portunus trituberculatus]|uniref:Uncharacterized protein n=1 Tax=Portunus trituberculatus TaxID=210409 RepID=A0A5B7GXV5_PORTR|nr:hypothetical protein [Portunus trituberculatus]